MFVEGALLIAQIASLLVVFFERQRSGAAKFALVTAISTTSAMAMLGHISHSEPNAPPQPPPTTADENSAIVGLVIIFLLIGLPVQDRSRSPFDEPRNVTMKFFASSAERRDLTKEGVSCS